VREITADALRARLDRSVELGRRAASGGKVATYIPELANCNPQHVAIAVCDVDGRLTTGGDADEAFTLQSVSKVFALARLLHAGDTDVFQHMSMEPSGDAFHSMVRLEEERGRPRNPLINAGAIVVSDRLPGKDAQARIEGLRSYLGRAHGKQASFEVNAAVFASERATGFRNRALANYMRHFGVVRDPDTAVDTYFRQCAITATVSELARAALFLANGGADPVTGTRCLSAEHNRWVLALMTLCGLYDEVGTFAVRVGLPAKSGVSGALLAVVPAHCVIACYGPALGPRGNSLAGVAMLELLSAELNLSIFDCL